MSDDYLIDPRSRGLAQMAMDNTRARIAVEHKLTIDKIRLDLVTKFALSLIETGDIRPAYTAHNVRIAIEYADTILSELGITPDKGEPK